MSPAAARWRGHVFGLELDSAWPLAGCAPGPSPPGLPRVDLDPAEPEALEVALPSASEAIVWSTGPDGRRLADVLAHHSAGYLVRAHGVATFHLSASGERLRAAPSAHIPDWRWQRSLLGRALPLAATVRGLEPLHASAVALPAGAVLIAGEPGLGKSTLAAELMLAGLEFLADDVVALDAGADGLRAHPGPGLLSIRLVTARRLSQAGLERLGARVGGDASGLRIAVRSRHRACPVLAIYLLDRVPSGAAARLTAMSAPEPARLLASTFNAAVRSPARLARQLDVFAALARGAHIARVSVPAGGDLGELAQLLLADLGAGGAGAAAGTGEDRG